MTRLFLAAPLAALLCAAGCATVAPYQRETLAQPEMDVQEREARAEVFRGHRDDSRRGAMAGSGHGGGGCGCN